jgi:hypothetical protein
MFPPEHGEPEEEDEIDDCRWKFHDGSPTDLALLISGLPNVALAAAAMCVLRLVSTEVDRRIGGRLCNLFSLNSRTNRFMLAGAAT